MTIIRNASIFATAAHSAIGQARKYTGDPYHVHVKNVAEIVSEVGGSDEMVAAALLHDTVEDTKITIEMIGHHFGEVVQQYVSELTDVSMMQDGNRAERKAVDRAHTAKASPEAKTIKLADLIDNSLTIRKYALGFANVYLAEKRLLLDEALKEGNPILWQIADLIVEKNSFMDFESVISWIKKSVG